MKAIQFARFGDRDVFEYVDLAAPKPKRDELLLEVAAAGVNFVDTRERQGIYGRAETYVGSRSARSSYHRPSMRMFWPSTYPSPRYPWKNPSQTRLVQLRRLSAASRVEVVTR